MWESEAFGAPGRFVIEAAIGTGSSGTVYRARDTRTDGRVAIKRLKSMDQADVLRFEREFGIVSGLDHPAIVTCSEAGKTKEGEPYLVMEWLEGESLRERLKRSELTLEETLALGARLASGLAYAHERGIVHRDVKPANVFLVAKDVTAAKLLDFGIARYMAAGETLTRPGEIVGTPGYVSPEQIRGERVDARSDLYSLGCVLFRCLTGRAAFEDDNVLEMLVRVTRDRAPSVTELRPELPPSLAGLVDRMLEREPVDRPESAALVLQELDMLASRAAGMSEDAPDLTSRPTARSPSLRALGDKGGGSGASRPSAGTVLGAALEPRTPLRTRGLAIAALLAAAVGVAGYVAYSRDASEPPAPGRAPSVPHSAAAPAVDRMGPEARAAWGSVRVGARNAALRRLKGRVKEKVASAGEHLWLALLLGPGEEAKRYQREATARVDDLTPFERSVLEAAAPLLATPADFRAADEKLGALAEREVAPELWLVLSRLRTQMNDREAALAAAAKADLEPWAVASLLERMYVEREFFQIEAARAAAGTCLEKRPDAPDCVGFLTRRAAYDGDCAQMESLARRWVGADPDDPGAYEMLGYALAARGESGEAIQEALEQQWARLDASERVTKRARDELMFDAYRGRLDLATKRARAAVESLPADSPLLERLMTSFLLVMTAAETEDLKLVGSVADKVLERASASNPSTPSEAAYFLLFVAAHEYPADEARWKDLSKKAFARYEDYIASQGANLRPYQRLMPWIVGYAAGASAPGRAQVAYEALPRYGELPPPGIFGDDVDLVIGNVLSRSGEMERGMKYLRRAAGSCLVLENPFAVIRSYKAIGEIQEKAGNMAEAREAYEKVLSYWPDPRPSSRSTKYARAGLERLRAKE